MNFTDPMGLWSLADTVSVAAAVVGVALAVAFAPVTALTVACIALGVVGGVASTVSGLQNTPVAPIGLPQDWEDALNGDYDYMDD